MRRSVRLFALLGIMAIIWVQRMPDSRAPRNQPGQKMDDFKLMDQSGQTRSFYSVARGKPTLVYYFKGCCNHCAALLPKIDELAQAGEAHGIAIVGVHYGNPSFCKLPKGQPQNGVGTVFADITGDICDRMGVGEFTTMTLNKKGVIQYRGNNVDHIDQIKKSLHI